MPDTPDEELVRRLLADARHDEPVPADVVARLDRVLDDLAAEGRAQEGGGRPLARDGRRPRRWAVGLVAAAAAAAAIVVAPRIGLSSSDHGDGSSSGSSASRAGSGADNGAPSAQDKAQAPAPSVVELHRRTLEADVRRAVRRLRKPGALLAAPPLPSCTEADWGPGTAVPALLDGRPAMLALRPGGGEHRAAEVLQCGTARVLASVTVPAR